MAGVVPEHLGVLNLSFNRLSQLPKALGSAPVLQQMYLANNQLTDLPDTFSKLPMVDLFLSENLFTTIPKAVLGMTQVGYHSRPIVKHDPCAYSVLWVSREMAQSFSGHAMAPIGEGEGTTHVGHFTIRCVCGVRWWGGHPLLAGCETWPSQPLPPINNLLPS